MQKILVKLEKLNKAILALENIYLKPTLEDRSNIDATIQRFEFAFELFWKLLKEFFQQQGLDIHYPKDILREAFSSQLIDQEDVWIQMLQDRNLTSHTYDEELANTVFAHIKVYVPLIRTAFDHISAIIIKEYI